MSRTWKQNPERLRERQELRRSNAAGTHGGGKRQRNRRERQQAKISVRNYQ